MKLTVKHTTYRTTKIKITIIVSPFLQIHCWEILKELTSIIYLFTLVITVCYFSISIPKYPISRKDLFTGKASRSIKNSHVCVVDSAPSSTPSWVFLSSRCESILFSFLLLFFLGVICSFLLQTQQGVPLCYKEPSKNAHRNKRL